MFRTVTWQAVLFALVLHSLWGGNPAAIKFSVLVFPPLSTAFYRFLIGAACLLLWYAVSRRPIWPARGEWRVLVLISAMFALQIATMNYGYANTTAAMGAILIASNPIFAAMFTHVLLAQHDRLSAVRVAGLVTAFAGTIVVLLEDAGPDAIQLTAWGNWVVLLSACMLGFRLGVTARAVQDIDPMRVALWQMLLSLPVFGLLSWQLETVRWEALAWGPVLGLLFQGVVIAGFGFTAMFYLMQRYSPSLMTSFNFVSPIAGVLLGVWLLDETLGVYLFAGMSLVAVGLVLISRPAVPASAGRG